MRQIVDSVAIKIELGRVVPEIADAVHAPSRPGNIRAAGFDRMQILRENIFSKLIVVRVRADTKPNVIMSDAIACNCVRIALIERKADRVLADLVLLESTAI